MNVQDLLGKRVVAGDGAPLGRLADLRARYEGGEIAITHLRLGLAAWIERLWPGPRLGSLFRRGAMLEIPWEAIASVDEEHIRLKPEWDAERCRACGCQGAI